MRSFEGARASPHSPVMKTISSLLSVVVSASLLGCGPNGFVGSRYVKSQTLSAAQGGALTISAADEPSLANTSIVFPPGALREDTTVTVELGLDDLSPGRASAVLVLGPAGTALEKDIEISLPLSLDARQRRADLFVEAKDRRITGAALRFDDSTGRVTFTSSSLKAYQAAAAALTTDGGAVACVTDDVCADNQDCVQGACTWKSSGSLACVTDDTCPWDDDCVAGQCVASSSSSDGGVDDHGGKGSDDDAGP